MSNQRFETTEMPKGRVFVDALGIVHVVYAPGAELGEEDARHAINGLKSLTQAMGRKAPVLVHPGTTRTLSVEARRLFRAKETTQLYTAMAVVVDNPLTRMIAAVLAAIQPDQTPTRLFGNEQEAMEWLQQFL